MKTFLAEKFVNLFKSQEKEQYKDKLEFCTGHRFTKTSELIQNEIFLDFINYTQHPDEEGVAVFN